MTHSQDIIARSANNRIGYWHQVSMRDLSAATPPWVRHLACSVGCYLVLCTSPFVICRRLYPVLCTSPDVIYRRLYPVVCTSPSVIYRRLYPVVCTSPAYHCCSFLLQLHNVPSLHWGRERKWSGKLRLLPEWKVWQRWTYELRVGCANSMFMYFYLVPVTKCWIRNSTCSTASCW